MDFHSHGASPNSWRVEKIPSFEMDDDWGYPYDLGNHPAVILNNDEFWLMVMKYDCEWMKWIGLSGENLTGAC